VQTTLRIDDAIYREAKAEAARRGMTLTRFIEEALEQKIRSGSHDPTGDLRAEVEERDRLMEALLKRTAHFRVGAHPTREEMSAR
jgi:antitoxin component of RelBE/YafQ-DinJ toxin-antitoxin module